MILSELVISVHFPGTVFKKGIWIENKISLFFLPPFKNEIRLAVNFSHLFF